jgi:PBSX family phage portal protein
VSADVTPIVKAADDAAEGPLEDKTPVVKVHAINYDDSTRSNLLGTGENEEDQGFVQAGALPPPYPPDFLCRQFENSNCLRQNVDAMATNIDGFGHRFVAVIDLDADDADDKLADAIYLERLDATPEAAATPGADDDDAIEMPTADEVAKRKEQMRKGMRKELARLEAWFDFCCHAYSFVELRRRTRTDKELLGYGYWEVIRNRFLKIVELKYAPGHTIRPRALGKDFVDVTVKIKSSPIAYREIQKRVRFRSYVQIVEGQKVFFKELGDPRIMSSKTGKFYETVEVMQAKERGSPMPATELIQFKVHTPRGAYGIPRWIGNLLSVMGSHEMETVNFLYWENKSIPPLAIIVENGRLGKGGAEAIRTTIKEQIKGKGNFHNILVLEGLPPTDQAGMVSDGKTRIKIQPLTDAMLKDGLFQGYDERNRDKVGESFRQPRLLRGDSRDFNRATADAVLKFAEQQVYAPERNDFDYQINRTVLPELDARYYTFQSLGPSLNDPEVKGRLLGLFVDKGIMTPAEARLDAHEVLGHELKKVEEDWAEQPFPLTLAQARSAAPGGGGGGGEPSGGDGGQQPEPAAKGDLVAQASHLIALRDAFAKAEVEHARSHHADAVAGSEPRTLTVRVSAEVMRALVEPK